MFGTLPPVGKNASRISAACWNWRKVVSESFRDVGFGFQTQVLPPRFTSGSRLAEKNFSIAPPGANSLAKSAIGTSRSLLEKKG